MTVPKLRFPEFENAGAWDAKEGDYLFASVSNKNHDSDLPILAITQDHGAIPRDLIDYHVSVSSQSIASYKVVEVGDFIISLRSFQGGIECSNYKGLCSPAYVILKNKIHLHKEFYKFYFKTNRFISDLNKNLEGLRDGKMISYKQFSEIYLPLPKKQEQQHIADCLSSLDDLISAEGAKLDTLKKHKKGLMQNLFPSEGENVPKLRFSEFKDAGAWVEKKLGDVVDYTNGKAHEKDIINDGKYVVVNSKFVSTEGAIRKYTNTPFCIANKDDLLMVLSDVPNGKAVAKCFLVDINNVYTVNQRICLLRPRGAIPNFLFSVISRNTFFLSFDDGVKQTNLRKDDVLSCPLLIPSLPEQQCIADCLSSLDDLIAAQTQKKETLKNHKKGLMQGLFPHID